MREEAVAAREEAVRAVEDRLRARELALDERERALGGREALAAIRPRTRMDEHAPIVARPGVYRKYSVDLDSRP